MCSMMLINKRVVVYTIMILLSFDVNNFKLEDETKVLEYKNMTRSYQKCLHVTKLNAIATKPRSPTVLYFNNLMCMLITPLQ